MIKLCFGGAFFVRVIHRYSGIYTLILTKIKREIVTSDLKSSSQWRREDANGRLVLAPL